MLAYLNYVRIKPAPRQTIVPGMLSYIPTYRGQKMMTHDASDWKSFSDRKLQLGQ